MVDVDETDEQIIYFLTREGRHTSAPDIAEEVDLAAPTVRNRIRRLEEDGVIRGYHADVDYEQVGGRLQNLYVCSTGDRDRGEMAQRVLQIPGVVNVREIMAGRGDLRVTAVGEDTNDLTSIAQEITALGIEIDDEDLVHREYFGAYDPFGPRDPAGVSPVTGLTGLSGNADVAEILVDDSAPIAGRTLEAANDEGFLSTDVLVVRIRRDDTTLTPTGDTTIRGGDFVVVNARGGLGDAALAAFTPE